MIPTEKSDGDPFAAVKMKAADHRCLPIIVVACFAGLLIGSCVTHVIESSEKDEHFQERSTLLTENTKLQGEVTALRHIPVDAWDCSVMERKYKTHNLTPDDRAQGLIMSWVRENATMDCTRTITESRRGTYRKKE